MSLSKNRNCYIDFAREPVPVGIISSTAATLATSSVLATGADTTATGYLLSGGRRLECYHTGATTVTGPTVDTSGWKFPIASGAFAMQMGGGSIQPGHPTFTVGTDSFYVRCKVTDTLIASNKALAVGFRKDGSYVATASAANLQAAYDDKYVLGTIDAGANWTAETSIAGVDAQKAITTPASPLVNATTYDIMVHVGLTGAVDATVNGVAVVHNPVSTYTFTAGLSLVPVVALLNITAGVACDAEFVEFEYGLSEV